VDLKLGFFFGWWLLMINKSWLFVQFFSMFLHFILVGTNCCFSCRSCLEVGRMHHLSPQLITVLGSSKPNSTTRLLHADECSFYDMKICGCATFWICLIWPFYFAGSSRRNWWCERSFWTYKCFGVQPWWEKVWFLPHLISYFLNLCQWILIR